MDKTKEKEGGERIAKVMARAGLCSRRDAEAWIVNGRVSLNGRILTSAAINVGKSDVILVDGKPLPKQDITRVWLYYKPKGLVTTAHDPEGRPTAFERLPPEMPRVISVGRLDLNSEGLLVLTNDGELARRLELPATGWIRRYRVRVNGRIDPQLLETLKGGIEIEGVRYGPIEATLERQQGANAWLNMALTEGKNREIRRICQHFDWPVSRLIRIGYGPFQLGEMEPGAVSEVRGKLLQSQLRFGNDWRPQANLGDEAEAPVQERPRRTENERKFPPRHRAEDRPTRGRPNRDRPNWDHAVDDRRAERRERPARQNREALAGEEAGQQKRSGFKKGWARNKPEKPQPGRSWKPRQKIDEALEAADQGRAKDRHADRGQHYGRPGGKPSGKPSGGPGGKPGGKPDRHASTDGKPGMGRPDSKGRPGSKGGSGGKGRPGGKGHAHRFR